MSALCEVMCCAGCTTDFQKQVNVKVIETYSTCECINIDLELLLANLQSFDGCNDPKGEIACGQCGHCTAQATLNDQYNMLECGSCGIKELACCRHGWSRMNL